eukprot:CAMPEP_0205944124 /NCGR_PEP_ID=MMETSP1325-20131115/62322_1 /ASSEMBLY_ACC=CAM_ASM_000708 /TAXON_ID=236786 /ORGANISM="Florenciella sp., Strain RCC1007" /LENGTH=116 /DNA_ID=CAMNT_0053314989 /DNA_START=32 /DNA_END=379 /DNA_ORIENTATION=+
MINDCHGYMGVMYCNDWRKKGHKIVGSGESIEVPFDDTLPCPLRITFAAKLGSYLKCGENNMYMALEFPNPGAYVVRIGGAGAQHVRLKSVKNEDESYEVDVDRHLFTEYAEFRSF